MSTRVWHTTPNVRTKLAQEFLNVSNHEILGNEICTERLNMQMQAVCDKSGSYFQCVVGLWIAATVLNFFPSACALELSVLDASVLKEGTLWTSVRLSSPLTCWIMESCRRSASRQRWWHTDPDTYSGTQLGQHRWVVGKQAAAGGRMDHKARPLAKFHHLLWIAWEAFSTATGGMSESHATANPHRAQSYWRCAVSLPSFMEFNMLRQN